MSYGLAVWHQSSKITNEEAAKIYIALCEEDISGVESHPSVEGFYTDVTSKHPEIDDIPEEEIDDHDLCPWSCAFDRSPGHLIMCCIWPKSKCVAALIFELAEKHGLAVFDPQSETINYPPDQFPASASSKPWWKFWS